MAGKQEKPIGDGINQMVSDCNATALFGDEISSRSVAACGDTRCAISGAKTAQRRDELGRAVSLPQQDRAWIPV
jgi:hypothetical protein